MDFVSLAAGTMVSAGILLLLKRERPELGLTASIGWLVLLTGWAAVKMRPITIELMGISEQAGIETDYLRLMLRCIGISLITGMAENVCKESGQLSAAAGIGTAGKVWILESCLPVYRELFSIVKTLIGGSG